MYRVNEMMGRYFKEVAMFETEAEANDYLMDRWTDYNEGYDSRDKEEEAMENFMSYFSIEDDGRESIDDGQLTEMYDDMLDECYPEMFGMSASLILYRADNIAYNCGLIDYYDSISDSYYCEEME